MRKLLLCFFIFIVSVPAFATIEYQAILNKCDETAQEDKKNAQSTVQMVQVINEHKNCYKKVATKIIDAEYAQNKQQMESEFDKFVHLSSELTYSMQYPDNCAPNCGTIVGLNAASSELEIIKAYVQQLLYVVSPE